MGRDFASEQLPFLEGAVAFVAGFALTIGLLRVLGLPTP